MNTTAAIDRAFATACDCDMHDCQSCTEATKLEKEQYVAWTSCRNRDAGESCFCGLCKAAR